MKKIITNSLFILVAMLAIQCFEEKERIVKVTPYDKIEEKLKELRALQKEINDVAVESTGLRARIAGILKELDELVPTNSTMSYSIGIVSTVTKDQAGISGAKVTLKLRDEVVTATSNSSGQVKFDNLLRGVAIVHISHPDYTDVSIIVDLISGASNVATAIGLYPLKANLGAMVHSGGIFYDPNRTDDILQNTDPKYGAVLFVDPNYSLGTNTQALFAPAPRLTLTNGVEDARPTIFPFLDARVQSWDLTTQPVVLFGAVQPDPFYYSYVPAGKSGNVILAVYEEMFGTATSANGGYSITLPNADRPLTYSYRLNEFEGTETYIRAENLSGATTTFTSRTRNVIFAPLYMEFGQTEFYPSTNGSFDPAKVNSFQFVWSSTIEQVPINFFYGAKSRNE